MKGTKYAVVAGGSKGIGIAIAKALAKRKYNLVLIGRHSEALRIAKNQLESEFGIHVETLTMDLSLKQSADDIAQWCIQRNLPVSMLCNVAGLGGAADYLTLPLHDLRYMINLNIESDIALSLRLLPLLEKNSPSYILNVGSMAGFAPIPVKNLYSATKSAIIFFSYSLRYQLKEKNISVSCLCPGPVFTKEEIVKDTIEKLGGFGKAIAVDPEKVGEIAVQGTLKGRLIIVPGFIAKSMSVLLRLLPRRFLVYLYHKLGKKK
jgi:short-subunit dehydrogenase